MNTSINKNIVLTEPQFQKEREYWMNLITKETTQSSFLKLKDLDISKNTNDTNYRMSISEEIYEKINRICKGSDQAIFVLLVSAIKFVIFRYSNINEITIAIPVLNSSETNELTNWLLLKSLITDTMSLSEGLEETKKNYLNALSNQNFPIDIFLHCNKANKKILNTIVHYTPIHSKEHMKDVYYDTAFLFNKTESGLELEVDFNDTRYDLFYIKQIVEDIQKTLVEIIENKDKKINQINLVNNKELVEIKKRNYSNSAIHQYFEERLNNWSDQIAVTHNGTSLTYSELNQLANQLATRLRNEGVEREDLVGIFMEPSIEFIISMLAILKAGGTYLPIDIKLPKDRINYMLKDSDAKFIIARSKNFNGITFQGKIIDVSSRQRDNNKSLIIENINSNRDLAYLIYTSGSTGQPKGVMIEHISVVNFIEGMSKKIDFSKGKKIIALTTVSFDIFIVESLLPLCNGMHIVFPDDQSKDNYQRLSQFISETQINMIQATPSKINLLVNQMKKGLYSYGSVTEFLIGGEKFPNDLYSKLTEISNANIYNLYGPTEATVWTTINKVRDEFDMNIGEPLENIEIKILNNELTEQPYGVMGELYISGEGLARGYYNRKDLTTRKFIQLDNKRFYRTGDLAKKYRDGYLEYIGREDHQVKLNGFRIELEEVENAIRKNPLVENVIVTVIENEILCAYILGDDILNPKLIIEDLMKILPEYMIPSRYIKLDEIPLTHNGKIDRNKLPSGETHLMKTNYYYPPRDELETKISIIWRKILELDEISILDDFFEIGGDSIKAVKLEIELEKSGFQVEEILVYSYRNIMEMASYFKKLS
ncbi:non-ribosomal peptide synthetase [Paenibacillus sp. OAE614]|uniref:amino acid adenylation domain-containing protein n=1 Tax=Paenibacillus sp. OAE614 TaxID=2663804 RepID=UPI00178AF9BE